MTLLEAPDFREPPRPEPVEEAPVPDPLTQEDEDWREYRELELPYLTEAEVWAYLDEFLEAYVAPDPGPFVGPREADPYRRLWMDLLQIAGGDLELLARWLASMGWPELPATTAERREARRASTDPWAGWPKLAARDRGRFAESGLPFWVQDVRYRAAGAYRQSKRWERVRATWQLLIESPHTGTVILVLAVGSPRRDEQCRWLAERCEAGRPLEVPLRLFWEKFSSGQKRLGLARTQAEGPIYDPAAAVRR